MRREQRRILQNKIIILRQKNNSISQISKNLDVSEATVIRWIKELRDQGLLTTHPRDVHNLIDGTTEHIKKLDSLVKKIVDGNPKIKNPELVEILARRDIFGIRMNRATVENSRLRLVARGELKRINLSPQQARILDRSVLRLRKQGLSPREIADNLEIPRRKVTTSIQRLIKKGKATRVDKKAPEIRAYIKEYRMTHRIINNAEIARKLGVSREWVRKLIKTS